jgi:hypothetical protein
MKKIMLASVFFAVGTVPLFTQAAALTQQQSTNLIAVIQSSPGTPASAFVNLITAFSNITTSQASSLISVVQSSPGTPANAFVNLLTSFTADTQATQSQQTVNSAPGSTSSNAPVIASISTSYSTKTGTAVIIHGVNFLGVTQISISKNNKELISMDPEAQFENVTVSSDGSSITFQQWDLPTDVYQVSVITPNGTSNSVDFSLESDLSGNVPTVTGVSPTSGSVGTTLTISGINLENAVGLLFYAQDTDYQGTTQSISVSPDGTGVTFVIPSSLPAGLYKVSVQSEIDGVVGVSLSALYSSNEFSVFQ